MSNEKFMPLEINDALVHAAEKTNAWPFVEARKILERVAGRDEVIFETGYGPSGLPHIGTFGEVARTSMIINAFRLLTRDEISVRLICFSDDMDAMRRVPDNVPNKEMLASHIDKPLSRVPNPFDSSHKSFAAHNNAQLCDFLDAFGFTYEFASATDYYSRGVFDEMLVRCAENYDAIMKIMLPTLGAERQATYSIFLPISPVSGKVLYVPIENVDAANASITFNDEHGARQTISIKGGGVKLQWKPDFAMRWAALGVDFEMYGKDHANNSNLYDRICRALQARPPQHFIYELFLDDVGEKISKSKGNGLSVEEWLAYAPTQSLANFMYTKPQTAKRLFFDVIPKNVDEYFSHLKSFSAQDAEARLKNPVWHIHCGSPPAINMPISFSMLLNLVSAANASEREVLWGFISKYAPDVSAASCPELDELVGFAIRYYADFIKPKKKFRAATLPERAALLELADKLEVAGSGDGEALQELVYAVGVAHKFEPLRDWFSALYQVLLGQEQGPRFGSFVALYGVAETVQLIREKLAEKAG